MKVTAATWWWWTAAAGAGVGAALWKRKRDRDRAAAAAAAASGDQAVLRGPGIGSLGSLGAPDASVLRGRAITPITLPPRRSTAGAPAPQAPPPVPAPAPAPSPAPASSPTAPETCTPVAPRSWYGMFTLLPGTRAFQPRPLRDITAVNVTVAEQQLRQMGYPVQPGDVTSRELQTAVFFRTACYQPPSAQYAIAYIDNVYRAVQGMPWLPLP